MTHMLPLAALALACVAPPAFAMSVMDLPEGYSPPAEYQLTA